MENIVVASVHLVKERTRIPWKMVLEQSKHEQLSCKCFAGAPVIANRVGIICRLDEVAAVIMQ